LVVQTSYVDACGSEIRAVKSCIFTKKSSISAVDLLTEQSTLPASHLHTDRFARIDTQSVQHRLPRERLLPSERDAFFL
jgi:hypothetical protein